MRPKNQNKRLLMIAVFGALLVCGAALVLSALKDGAQFFYNPGEVLVEGFVPESDAIKIGGLVVPGSISKDDNLTTTFDIVDFPEEGETARTDINRVKVIYVGVLPDLFAEGDGVVVSGRLTDQVLEASEVLAKHDENYQPVKKKSQY